MYLREISEHELKALVKDVLTISSHLLAEDDDAVAYQNPSKVSVINVDTFVASTDKPTLMSWKSAGYKSVIAATSDIVAKGAKPYFALASLTLNVDMKVDDVLEIFRGIDLACRKYNIKYLGGDINKAGETTITVTVIGGMERQPVPRHNHLEVGMMIYWVGPPLGAVGAALNSILRGEESELDQHVFYPELPLEFLEISRKFEVVSAMDSSDSLSETIHALLERTRLGASLFEITVNSEVRNISRNLQDDIFHCGEEYGVMFISRESIPMALQIGEITANKGVSYGGRKIERRGWDHFQSEK